MVENENLDALTELRNMLSIYIEQNPDVTLHKISSKGGVPPSTLRSIFFGETKQLTFSSAVQIVSVIAEPKVLLQFMEKHYPQPSRSIKEIFQKDSKNVLTSEVFRSHLLNSTMNLIFAIASTRKGTTFDQIKRLFGEAGTGALDRLITGRLLKSDGQTVKYEKAGLFSIANVEDALANIIIRIQNFNTALVGTKGASLMSTTESVNLEALEEIKSVLVEANNKIVRIIRSEKSYGDIPVWTSILMNVLDASKLEK